MRVLCAVPRRPDAAAFNHAFFDGSDRPGPGAAGEITDCVRTYSIENGLDQVPEQAAKVGLKVIQGIWLGSDRLKNQAQISTVIGLTKQFPAVITAVVVGNEVLLRGE